MQVSLSDFVDALVSLFDLEPIDDNVFRGKSPDDERQRVFGGQVAGQALIAAGRTVEVGRAVHSLHAYFIRPGDPKIPLLYEVERIRDGGSFSTRRVLAIQHGRPIFNLSASFQQDEPGPEYQASMPDVPPPDSLPEFSKAIQESEDPMAGWYSKARPFEVRFVSEPVMGSGSVAPREPVQQIWMRAAGILPDDPLLHACVLAYASDMTLIDAVLLPFGKSVIDTSVFAASLDHAMWFHRQGRADEWFLYDMASPTSQQSRGLASGAMYDRSGRRLITVMQEGLIRIRRP